MGKGPVQALGSLTRHLRSELEKAGKPDAALDARLIVEHVTGAAQTRMLLEPNLPVSPGEIEAALALLVRRLAGEPVHRILGHREFYGLRLALSPGTLEPRPDTEALVELALPLVRAAADRHGRCRILDLGTGTGAIALALLKEEPRATATGTDISADALATAAANADLCGEADRFATLKSHWFADVEGRFHIIVSNPPYIASDTVPSLEREVRDFDPLAALDGGKDGLDAYRAIANGAMRHLEDCGAVAVEIGYDQDETVPAIFAGRGFVLAQGARDLSGTLRAFAFMLESP